MFTHLSKDDRTCISADTPSADQIHAEMAQASQALAVTQKIAAFGCSNKLHSNTNVKMWCTFLATTSCIRIHTVIVKATNWTTAVAIEPKSALSSCVLANLTAHGFAAANKQTKEINTPMNTEPHQLVGRAGAPRTVPTPKKNVL